MFLPQKILTIQRVMLIRVLRVVVQIMIYVVALVAYLKMVVTPPLVLACTVYVILHIRHLGGVVSNESIGVADGGQVDIIGQLALPLRKRDMRKHKLMRVCAVTYSNQKHL